MLPEKKIWHFFYYRASSYYIEPSLISIPTVTLHEFLERLLEQIKMYPRGTLNTKGGLSSPERTCDSLLSR